MTKTIRTLIISAFALTVLLALAAFTSVNTASAHGGRGGGFGVPGAPRGLIDRDELNAVVADALGISVDELEAAYADGTRLPDLAEELGVEMDVVEEAVYNASVSAVNAAVTAGDLTQEEADVILERLELQRLARQVIDEDVINAAVADLLGVSVDELEAAKTERGAMADLIEAAGVTAADVRDTIETTRQELIDAAVADGTLTAEQAEQIAAGGGCGGGIGFGTGRGGRRGGGFGRDSAPTTPSTTDTSVDA